MADNNLYEDFIKTLEGNKDREFPIMTHLPSNIRKARMIFEGYLAEEELQERQYNGRFWDICQDLDNSSLYKLYILLDNETVLFVEAKVGLTNKISNVISEDTYIRDVVKSVLPQSLRGRFYDFRLYN